MRIMLECAGVHECGEDGIAGRALVYSCEIFLILFFSAKRRYEEERNHINI